MPRFPSRAARMGALSVVVVVASGCASASAISAASATEEGRAAVLSILLNAGAAFLCEKATGHHVLDGGVEFTVARGGCRFHATREEITIDVDGEGRVEKLGGLVATGFRQRVLATYDVEVHTPPLRFHVLVLPRTVDVKPPEITDPSLLVAVAEELGGLASAAIQSGFRARFDRPYTLITNVEGRNCTVDGYVEVGRTPVRCMASKDAPEWSPRTGDFEPLPAVPTTAPDDAGTPDPSAPSPT